MTGGHGSFAMEFSHYEAVPASVQQEIVARHKPSDSDD
jgi:elongation factor G